MFESIRDGLGAALKTLQGKGKLTEGNMKEGLGLVRTALLEADVSYEVTQDFMGKVTEQATGEKVMKLINPTQAVVGIVHQELVNLMGPVDPSLHLRPGVNVIMMCGLQGSGKTTTCAKLAKLVAKHDKKVMLAAADLQRPAAIHQLQVLGEQIGVPVHAGTTGGDPVRVCQDAYKAAKSQGIDVLILDTAGRLHVDDELMRELKQIDNKVEPHQVYLVVDAMTGQDAVNSAKVFNEALELDGVILTKLDGDARGGAALSVKKVTGVPIKFVGMGEHIDDLDEFSPERMAGRILGMGDVVSLVRQAQEKFDQDEVAKAEEAMRKGEFTLDDFRKQMTQISKLGPLNKVMEMIPGMGGMSEMMKNTNPDGDFRRLCGIIDSMTPAERRNPTVILDQSRRRRIAAGAGVQAHEVNELVKQFDAMAGMMKKMAGMNMFQRMKEMQKLSQSGALNPGAKLAKQKQSTGKRLTNAERAKNRKLKEKEARRRRQERNQDKPN